MRNEALLIVTLLVLYGSVLLWFALFGTSGLMGFTVFATIAANIEVLILVQAFGMEMTLGNILFATTFLVTDILSEIAGKKQAQQAVWIGIAANVLFVVVSQSWLMYIPSAEDWVTPPIRSIFPNTPRLMLASLAVYAIVQVFDVWLYHKWWDLTQRLSGDRRGYLWVRNNGSTLISQLLNAILYTAFAFYGMYDIPTLVSIVLSSYVIFIFTSLLDTPIVYWARLIHEKKQALQSERFPPSREIS